MALTAYGDSQLHSSVLYVEFLERFTAVDLTASPQGGVREKLDENPQRGIGLCRTVPRSARYQMSWPAGAVSAIFLGRRSCLMNGTRKRGSGSERNVVPGINAIQGRLIRIPV